MKRRGFFRSIATLALGAALSTPLAVLCSRVEKRPKQIGISVICRDQENRIIEEIVYVDENIDIRELSDYFLKMGLRLGVSSVALPEKVVDHYGEDLIKAML